MKCQKNKFQLQGKISYLNCAYMSPMLKKVEKAGKMGIMKKRKPYQVGVEDFFREGETARNLFSTLVNAAQANRCVIIPSVSYAMSNVVKNLPRKKGTIVLAEEQFPSNVYPWTNLDYKIKTITAPNIEKRGEGWSEAIIDAINMETAAVAIGHVHWADGTKFALEKIREKCDETGTALVIDGTQSVGALPFDIQKIRPDALVCAGYKWLMGPYSIGMAYYGEIFDGGAPIENNWINRLGAEDFGGLVNYRDEYMEGALRYEVGEHSNFILLPMFIAGLKQVLSWQPQKIQAYCYDVMGDAIENLVSLGYVIEDEKFRGHHLFGVRLPKDVAMDDVQKQLKINKVSVSLRGTAIRVSPNVYNDERDAKRLIKALKTAKMEG